MSTCPDGYTVRNVLGHICGECIPSITMNGLPGHKGNKTNNKGKTSYESIGNGVIQIILWR